MSYAPVMDPFFQSGQDFTDPDTDNVREWLTPVGDTGFWVTPNEPADVFDCDRYPRSPLCTLETPGDLIRRQVIGLGVETFASECEICVDLQADLFGIPLPDYSICYRFNRPGCDPPGGDQSPGGPSNYRGGFRGDPFPPGCVRQTLWLAWVPASPPVPGRPFPPPVAIFVPGTVFTSEPVTDIDYFVYTPENTLGGVPYWAARVGVASEPEGPTQFFGDSPPSFPRPIFLGTRLVESQPPTCNYVPPPPPPPPPPFRPPGNDMCDCEETANLLRLIARRLGVQDYPVRVPQFLTRNNSNDNQQQLQSLTQFTTWLTYQMDALVGEFPIRIQIEDIDPTQEGNQEANVRLPNIAEALAELYGLAVKSSVNSDIHTDFLMRLAAEAIATKNAALVTQDYAKANAAFLGYEGNPKKHKIPYAFNPKNLDSLETILNNTTAEIVGWENTGKDTALEFFRNLMFSAGIVKAVHYRKAADLARMLGEVGSILGVNDPLEERQEEEWGDYIESLNDPESDFNRGAPTRPIVRDPEIEQGNQGGNQGQGGGS